MWAAFAVCAILKGVMVKSCAMFFRLYRAGQSRPGMTKEQIEAVFDRVRAWPEHRQLEAAALLLSIESEEDMYPLSEEERADLEEGLAEMERGEVASEEQVTAVFRRAHRPGVKTK